MPPTIKASKSQIDVSEEGSTSERRLVFFRLLVFFCLIAAAVVCGVGAYILTYQYEGDLGVTQFESIAGQFETFVKDNLKSKVLALESQGSLMSRACPYASNWPNCTYPMTSYQNVTDPLILITKTRTMSFSVIITPEQAPGLEAHAYNFYASEGYPKAGISSFGKGISATNVTTGKKYHDKHGLIHGKRNIMVPTVEVGDLAHNTAAVMYNTYSDPTRAKALDATMDCFDNGGKVSDCNAITDNLFLIQDPLVFRPAVWIVHAVTPFYNTSLLTGFIRGVYNWDTVFISALPAYVPDVDIVLSGGTSLFTFRIKGGALVSCSVGDHHDAAHELKGRSFSLNTFIGTFNYHVVIYPTDAFVNRYRSSNPYVVMGIAVGIIVFASVVFLLYDLFVNRSSVEKELRTAINTKRLFVRFISHEIRTPLNTVHIGLQLLVSEMKEFLSSPLGLNSKSPAETSAAARVHDWMTLIEDIEESADTGILVLNDLINYDKISMGTLNADFELLSLWDLVRVTTHQHQVAARRAGVSLLLRLEIDEPSVSAQRHVMLQRLMVVGDSVKLSQIVRNLVSNALKFSKQGSAVEVCVNWDEHGLSDAHIPGEIGAAYNPVLVRDAKSGSVVPSQSAVSARAGALILRVIDSGAGISLQDQQSLFQEGKQFRANQLQAGQGSGLGLWISKGLVNLHNGTLSAFSAGEDKGAEFRLELPAILDQPEATALRLKTQISGADKTFADSEKEHYPDLQDEAQVYSYHNVHSIHASSVPSPRSIRSALSTHVAVSPRPERSFRSSPVVHDSSSISGVSNYGQLMTSVGGNDKVQNVMVVDDSGPSRKVLCRLLRNAGYNCYEAADGEDCVTKMSVFEQEGPVIDMVFMDFEMPKMNGPTATQALRDMGVTIPIVGVTGNVLPADKEYFLNHGANAVLHKPLKIDSLKAEIVKYNGIPRSKTASSMGEEMV